jgi:hypothetical protein
VDQATLQIRPRKISAIIDGRTTLSVRTRRERRRHRSKSARRGSAKGSDRGAPAAVIALI